MLFTNHTLLWPLCLCWWNLVHVHDHVHMYFCGDSLMAWHKRGGEEARGRERGRNMLLWASSTRGWGWEKLPPLTLQFENSLPSQTVQPSPHYILIIHLFLFGHTHLHCKDWTSPCPPTKFYKWTLYCHVTATSIDTNLLHIKEMWPVTVTTGRGIASSEGEAQSHAHTWKLPLVLRASFLPFILQDISSEAQSPSSY